jgi:putative tricarboxylic transport membrane protein
VVGCYALRNSMLDVWVMLAAGVLGYVLGRHKVPPAPLLVAFILTRPFEEALRQALIASEGDLSVFVARPIAAALLALMLLVLLLTIRRQLGARRP